MKQSLENSKANKVSEGGNDLSNYDGDEDFDDAIGIESSSGIAGDEENSYWSELNGDIESEDNSDKKKNKTADSSKQNPNSKQQHSQNNTVSSSSSINDLLNESAATTLTETDDIINVDEGEEALAAITKHAQLLNYRRRKSLAPPPLPQVTWQQYISAPKGHPPCLSRPWKTKETVRTFKATLGMSKDFPLSVESLLNVLEVVSPFKHFQKLKRFVELNLPEGFPVKIGESVIDFIYYKYFCFNFSKYIFNNRYSSIPCNFGSSFLFKF